MKLFIALIEVRLPVVSVPNPCEVNAPLVQSGAAGAAVRCYIPAESDSEAMSKLQTALKRDQLALVEVEFCTPANGTWERADDGSDTDGIERALRSGSVEYGSFHVWGHDAPDAHSHPEFFKPNSN